MEAIDGTGTEGVHQEAGDGAVPTKVPTIGSPDVLDGGLFADFSEPLRRDLQYLDAALSTYWGGPAGDDVRGAWDRLLLNFRDTRADYLRVLGEKADMILANAAMKDLAK